MFNEDESVVITFNGEIYDFADLMEELKAAGHVFQTHCDTEVIIHAWEEWGASCLDHLHGMFAFAIWDRNRETNRAWLGLNMMTEGRAGFRAFNEGSKQCREADFLLLRRRLAEGSVWGEDLIEEVLAKAHGKELAGR